MSSNSDSQSGQACDGGIMGQSSQGWEGEVLGLWGPRRVPDPGWWVVQEGFLEETGTGKRRNSRTWGGCRVSVLGRGNYMCQGLKMLL